MGDYRRFYLPGGTYFFTLVTAGRRPWMSGEDELDVLRETCRRVAREQPFESLAAVILPDHLHCIWRLPAGDADFSTRWKRIKRITTNGLQARGISGPFWQSRFWEHWIRDEEDLRRHMDYVHFNPVRHGYVARAADWSASSLHHYIRKGWYPEDWAADPGDLAEVVGEPRRD